mmetsp:Transcript_19646/g.33015  ORF Transcript_19646/g.33015 Transcript_19646/m.33015 type:complete len:283 (-) Transcript_19646:493-1341(-)|eukprot:CAMPEP_0198210204 /NCGR_PEP_ID=MMETSP1445-20131203/19955_1 /TAXON_ID=36898 /ORGANISM="Pyramimonas sp., Strain CCMP2087" /LENGTH=282 /DNA_ID=CAMNT_0043884201 /DNA_START=136 /DNA_END=984 /DNA_ORIENTATION=-
MCNKVKGGEGSRQAPVITDGSVGADGEEVVRKHVIRRIEPEGTDDKPFKVDPSQGLVLQVGKLGPHYEKWVHTPDLGRDPLRFFNNPVLEFFSRNHWWTIPLVWLPVAFAFISSSLVQYQTPHLTALKLTAFGVLVWSFAEYMLHRFLFHTIPASYWGITLHFVLHGCHHKRPMDRLRLVFPPAAALPLVCLITLLLNVLLPQDVFQYVTGGTLIGYVAYDMSHYYFHHGRNHQGTIIGQMKSRHMSHHYKDHSVSFGISSPLWDHVFGTYPSSLSVDKKKS